MLPDLGDEVRNEDHKENKRVAMESARAWLAARGFEERIQTFTVSSATVELAAQAVGVEPGCIAKTISLYDGESAMLILAAGDAKIDNHKVKEQFGRKPKMLSPEDALRFTGHAVGGICPFGLANPLRVFLDASLRRFPVVYPACGTASSAVQLTCSELEEVSEAMGWVDVCKLPEAE